MTFAINAQAMMLRNTMLQDPRKRLLGRTSLAILKAVLGNNVLVSTAGQSKTEWLTFLGVLIQSLCIPCFCQAARASPTSGLCTRVAGLDGN